VNLNLISDLQVDESVQTWSLLSIGSPIWTKCFRYRLWLWFSSISDLSPLLTYAEAETFCKYSSLQ